MKKFAIKSLPETKRNGKCIEINSGNGSLVSVEAINDTDAINVFNCILLVVLR